MRVAYFGPEGTYTSRHGEVVALCRRRLWRRSMFSGEVESGVCDYGVALENSREGMVNLTLDCLLNTNARVCAEVELAIHHA